MLFAQFRDLPLDVLQTYNILLVDLLILLGNRLLLHLDEALPRINYEVSLVIGVPLEELFSLRFFQEVASHRVPLVM